MADPSAYEWAELARATRRDLLEDLAAGRETLSGALDRAQEDPLIGRIYVLVVLEALPGAGKVATRRALDRLGIEHRTPLADVPADVVLANFGGES